MASGQVLFEHELRSQRFQQWRWPDAIALIPGATAIERIRLPRLEEGRPQQPASSWTLTGHEYCIEGWNFVNTNDIGYLSRCDVTKQPYRCGLRRRRRA